MSAEALTEPSSSSLDLAPCGLIRLDRHFRIQTANRYAHRLSGRAAEEPLDGLGFNDLLSIASRIFAQTRLWPELALAGAVEEMALDLVRPDGDRVPVLLNALQSVDDAGGPGDIHIALVRAAAQRPHAAEARRARAAAEQAGRAKSDFLANVSHEIRTPLNGIIGVTGALERTELTPQQREMVQLIQSSGGMLERLVSDVLELSKVEAGGLQLEVRPFDLGLELRSVLDLSQIRADEKGLGFRVELADDVRGMVTGDSVRLKQILGNLLSNAVKFTESGEVRVSIGFERGEAGADVLAMSITDTGQGFDQATADTLFQRFQQADTGITRRFGGTGLGLAICKALLELMGGSIEVQSIPGTGSRFCARVPLPRAEEASCETVAACEADEAIPQLRILLVEDHPTNQKVVELLLMPYGVDLVWAVDGALGVQAWREGRYDLVLMDMQMPVMDGLTATRAIREAEALEPARGRTPIAMLSANAMEHHRQESIAAGADVHISKPVTPASLIAGIQAALAVGVPASSADAA